MAKTGLAKKKINGVSARRRPKPRFARHGMPVIRQNILYPLARSILIVYPDSHAPSSPPAMAA